MTIPKKLTTYKITVTSFNEETTVYHILSVTCVQALSDLWGHLYQTDEAFLDRVLPYCKIEIFPTNVYENLIICQEIGIEKD